MVLRYKVVHERADAFYFNLHDVARAQESLGIETGADAARRSR
jgi:hypothetical protein